MHYSSKYIENIQNAYFSNLQYYSTTGLRQDLERLSRGFGKDLGRIGKISYIIVAYTQNVHKCTICKFCCMGFRTFGTDLARDTIWHGFGTGQDLARICHIWQGFRTGRIRHGFRTFGTDLARARFGTGHIRQNQTNSYV